MTPFDKTLYKVKEHNLQRKNPVITPFDKNCTKRTNRQTNLRPRSIKRLTTSVSISIRLEKTDPRQRSKKKKVWKGKGFPCRTWGGWGEEANKVWPYIVLLLALSVGRMTVVTTSILLSAGHLHDPPPRTSCTARASIIYLLSSTFHLLSGGRQEGRVRCLWTGWAPTPTEPTYPSGEEMRT